ncbi:MAG: hypothetical protein ACI8UO_001125 [Verrucomicrobiales bacterium]|jgi:hypothetical protein
MQENSIKTVDPSESYETEMDSRLQKSLELYKKGDRGESAEVVLKRIEEKAESRRQAATESVA